VKGLHAYEKEVIKMLLLFSAFLLLAAGPSYAYTLDGTDNAYGFFNISNNSGIADTLAEQFMVEVIGVHNYVRFNLSSTVKK
jgi:hypothetical protein